VVGVVTNHQNSALINKLSQQFYVYSYNNYLRQVEAIKLFEILYTHHLPTKKENPNCKPFSGRVRKFYSSCMESFWNKISPPVFRRGYWRMPLGQEPIGVVDSRRTKTQNMATLWQQNHQPAHNQLLRKLCGFIFSKTRHHFGTNLEQIASFLLPPAQKSRIISYTAL